MATRVRSLVALLVWQMFGEFRTSQRPKVTSDITQPFPDQYLTSSSASSSVILDFFLTSLAGSSFLQAASEKVTPMTNINMKIGNDNFMTGSFPIETRLLLWNPYKRIIAHLKFLMLWPPGNGWLFLFIRGSGNYVFLKIWLIQNNARGFIRIFSQNIKQKGLTTEATGFEFYYQRP